MLRKTLLILTLFTLFAVPAFAQVTYYVYVIPGTPTPPPAPIPPGVFVKNDLAYPIGAVVSMQNPYDPGIWTGAQYILPGQTIRLGTTTLGTRKLPVWIGTQAPFTQGFIGYLVGNDDSFTSSVFPVLPGFTMSAPTRGMRRCMFEQSGNDIVYTVR